MYSDDKIIKLPAYQTIIILFFIILLPLIVVRACGTVYVPNIILLYYNVN